MLSITEFMLTKPSSGQTISASTHFEISNSTSESITQVSYCATFFDPNGAYVGFYNTPVPEECELSTGESLELSAYTSLQHRSSFQEQDSFTVEIDAHLFAGRVIRLGQLECPSLSNPVSAHKGKSEGANFTANAALSASIETSDDRDDCDLILRALVTTDSLELLHECRVEFVVHDEVGEELYSDWMPANILKRGSGVFEAGFYNLDGRELGKGYITATLTTFEQVEVLRAKEAAQPE